MSAMYGANFDADGKPIDRYADKPVTCRSCRRIFLMPDGMVIAGLKDGSVYIVAPLNVRAWEAAPPRSLWGHCPSCLTSDAVARPVELQMAIVRQRISDLREVGVDPENVASYAVAEQMRADEFRRHTAFADWNAARASTLPADMSAEVDAIMAALAVDVDDFEAWTAVTL